jgi:DNA invertase Pin-like site-specific DNA recombinase
LRPGLQDVLEYLDQHQVDALVVYSVDRLARTARELDELVERLKGRLVELRTVADFPNNS